MIYIPPPPTMIYNDPPPLPPNCKQIHLAKYKEAVRDKLHFLYVIILSYFFSVTMAEPI